MKGKSLKDNRFWLGDLIIALKLSLKKEMLF